MSLIPTRQVLPLTIVFLQAAAASSSGTILIFRIRGGSYGWRESPLLSSMRLPFPPDLALGGQGQPQGGIPQQAPAFHHRLHLRVGLQCLRLCLA